jgi:chemotaxis protein methyltransferase CheR
MTPVRTPPTRLRSQDKPLVPGEFLLTGEDFQAIAAMLHADAGIYLAETKATLVYSRLAKRLRALGLESFREYCTLIAGAEGVGERQKMIAALTTNVTRFFREPHHFEHLRTRVLMPLADAARRGRRLRLWSAASSSGQEPYSIALTVLSVLPEAASLDIRVLDRPAHDRRRAHWHLRRERHRRRAARAQAQLLRQDVGPWRQDVGRGG